MNSKGSGGRPEGFFTGKGFYIVLFLCAAVIGVSAWMIAAGDMTMAENEELIAVDNHRVETVVIPALDDVTEPVMSYDNPIKLDPPKIETQGILEVEPVIETAVPDIYIWPVTGELEREYSVEALKYDVTMRDWRTHAGIDIEAPLGTTVNAAHAGIVETVYDDDFYGTVVAVSHGDGTASIYANLAAAPAVAVGDRVTVGDTIGSVGTTALCEIGQGTHLHFAVTCGGEFVDPMSYLPA